MSYDHSIEEELDKVHAKMIAKYNMKKAARRDIATAKRMEYYLRIFKALGNQHDDRIQPVFQNALEAEAFTQISEQVGQALGIKNYSLFRNQHQWYLNSGERWGADDVFEAELTQLLNIALEESSVETADIKDAGASLVGNIPGNISKRYLELLKQRGQSIVNATSKPSQLIDVPQFRAGKSDVKGYSASFDISANVRPEWQEFITLFKGVSCTLKNYSSKSSTEVIHLGKTTIEKAILGELSELSYSPKKALHIYDHTIDSYLSANRAVNKQEVGGHIQHLRFAYELAGGGLYDAEGNRLDQADFFIYNDPSSNNIWVRSTKEMIANAMDYMDLGMKDPLHSGMVVLKQAFV